MATPTSGQVGLPITEIRDPDVVISGSGSVAFGGNGVATTASRSDHNHNAAYLAIGAAAGGDLSVTYPNPTVAKIQGRAVAATAPSDTQVLTWSSSGSNWAPATPSAGSSLSVYHRKGNVLAGNLFPQGAVAPPSGAGMADISVLGNAYNSVFDSHTGYWLGSWQYISDRIRAYADVNNSAGVNQGFTVAMESGSIVVRNKNAMTNNQTGDVTIVFYGTQSIAL